MTFDIFMIACGEPNAAQNWARLRSIAPEARLIENVRGVYECYAACAAASRTPYFFVVDADNWVFDDFRFEVPFEPRADEIASWGAINPINGLAYGHGSIKLFPKTLFAARPERNLGLDFVLSLGERVRFIDTPASEHRFNTDPRATWSAAFRECVKLVMLTREGTPHVRALAERHLETWCSQGTQGQFASWCVAGAREGSAYAQTHHADRAALDRINDYAWMRAAFAERGETASNPSAKAPAFRGRGAPRILAVKAAPPDIFMIAYGEPNAAENWARLRSIAPGARLVENVRGITAGYAACAEAAQSSHFFAVDADNWILDGFRFEVPFKPAADEIALWYAENPINGLRYGHGAIKLIPTALMKSVAQGVFLDFSGSAARNRYTEICASEHRFNADPYSTWAGAFRECAKLAIGAKGGSEKSRALALHRLKAWCTLGSEAKFGPWCLRGAREGRLYGLEHRKDFASFQRINDFDWLRDRFRANHVRKIVIPQTS